MRRSLEVGSVMMRVYPLIDEVQTYIQSALLSASVIMYVYIEVQV